MLRFIGFILDDKNGFVLRVTMEIALGKINFLET